MPFWWGRFGASTKLHHSSCGREPERIESSPEYRSRHEALREVPAEAKGECQCCRLSPEATEESRARLREFSYGRVPATDPDAECSCCRRVGFLRYTFSDGPWSSASIRIYTTLCRDC